MINIFKQDNDKKLLIHIHERFKKDRWVNGKIVKVLEKNIKKYLKISHSVYTCNSGSDALMLALLLDKKKKDIYITTPISYLATSSIPKFLNLNLIYIDVNENNYLMSITKLKDFLKNCPKKIMKRIAGVINVELFGQTSNLQELKQITKKYKLSLIGDCAQSFGTLYKKKSSIAYYDYAITSFYPTKIFSCYGDGGAIFTKKVIKKLPLLKNNGHSESNKSICKIIGINSRLDSLQAYILNEKLLKFKYILHKKKLIFKFLLNNLHGTCQIPKFDKYVNSNHYIFSLYANPKLRKKILNFLNINKIESKSFYPIPISRNKLLKPIYKTNLKNTKYCCKSLICLPSHENLTKKQLFKISNVFNSFN